MPLTSVTLMLPASATRPEAVIIALVEATWPLLMPIETWRRCRRRLLDEAIWTFHSPSKLAAAAGVANGIATSDRMRMAMIALRNCPMTCPCVERGQRHIAVAERM